jgi:hypothetical protein
LIDSMIVASRNRKYVLEHLHPGLSILAIHFLHRDSCKHISLFCFSPIEHVLNFKLPQHSKDFYLESGIKLSDFFVQYKYTN